MKSKKLSNKLTQFEGIFLTKFSQLHPANITALALIFEKIFLPDNIELFLDIEEYKKLGLIDDGEFLLSFKKYPKGEGEFEAEVLSPANLSEKDIEIIVGYMLENHSFCMQYHELFPQIFETEMIKGGIPMTAELLEKGKKGQLNKYNVSIHPIKSKYDGLVSIEKRIKQGATPILTPHAKHSTQKNINSNKSIAALLAMKTISLLFPETQEVNSELILEARDKLSNHLPPFWSAMLKFSIEGKKIFDESQSTEEALIECNNLVDSSIRPALIDLNEKIIREKKNWFYKILSPIANYSKLLIGRPNISQLDLIKSSLALSGETIVDYVQHKNKIKELQDEAGLTYLLRLNQLITK